MVLLIIPQTRIIMTVAESKGVLIAKMNIMDHFVNVTYTRKSVKTCEECEYAYRCENRIV